MNHFISSIFPPLPMSRKKSSASNIMCIQYVVKHNLVLDGMLRFTFSKISIPSSTKLCLTTYCIHITFDLFYTQRGWRTSKKSAIFPCFPQLIHTRYKRHLSHSLWFHHRIRMWWRANILKWYSLRIFLSSEVWRCVAFIVTIDLPRRKDSRILRTSVYVYQGTWRYKPEDNRGHTRRCENLVSTLCSTTVYSLCYKLELKKTTILTTQNRSFEQSLNPSKINHGCERTLQDWRKIQLLLVLQGSALQIK